MKSLILTALTCLLIACGSSPVSEQHYYLLRAESGSARATTHTVVGRVSLASYLEPAGVVIETHSEEVNYAQYHRWAEPLAEMIKRYLASTLATHAVSKPLTVDIVVDVFHGTLAGEVILEASWTYREADIPGNSIATKADLDADGYGAVVRAHREVLDTLAAAITRDAEVKTALAQ